MNIALVGLGGMGAVHWHNFAHIEDARVTAAVGVSDIDRERAGEWGIPLYGSINELCDKESVDLIDICAPTFLHKQLALESIARGKHTITEKPAALSLNDAMQMFNSAERAGVQFYVAQVLQFTPEIAALRRVARDNRYGRALDAHFERLTARPAWSQGSWLFDKEKSGLLPYDLHIHDLDVIVSVFGKPDSASCMSCAGKSVKYKEHYRFLYGYDNGLNVCAEAGWLNASIPFTARWRVYFERGMLVCENGALTGYSADGETTVFDVTEPIKISTGINVPPTGMFLSELNHFVSRAREGKPSELVPRAQVLSVLETLECLKL